MSCCSDMKLKAGTQEWDKDRIHDRDWDRKHDQEREITRCNNIAFSATEKGEAKVGAGRGEKGKARTTFMRTIHALDWLINGFNSKSTVPGSLSALIMPPIKLNLVGSKFL